MTLQEAIAMADELKPNAFSTQTKVAWINALEGRIALSVFLMSEEDTEQLHYSTDDLDTALLVKPPYDDIYELWLEAKIDYANGEYDKYQNTMAEYNAHYGEFVRWFAEKYRPAQPHCGCPRTPEYYISAYALAVNAGFEGSMAEWLASLRGDAGPVYIPSVANGVLYWTNNGGLANPEPVNVAGPGLDGVSPILGVTAITGGHRITIIDATHPQTNPLTVDVMDGEDGETGEQGVAGVSPSVSVTTITGGHRITIVDATHPQTNPLVFDVMDGNGAGDMRASTYDTTGKAQDIFAYVDALGVTSEAKAAWAEGIKRETTVTLTAAGWTLNGGVYSQSVSVTGLSASGPVIVQAALTADDASANEARASDFAKATRLKTAQAAGSLTFRTDVAPTNDVIVEVAY